MSLQTRTLAARYTARWGYLNLAWLITVLSANGARFAALGQQGALVALVLVNAAWLAHVALAVADSGTLPAEPPAANPDPPPPQQPPQS